MTDLFGDETTFDGLHSLRNALIIGVYLRFLGDNRLDLAEAWTACHVSWSAGKAPLAASGLYSKTAREVEILSLRPMSEAGAKALQESLPYVRRVAWEFAGDLQGENPIQESPIWVDVQEPVEPSSKSRRRELLSAVAALDVRDHPRLADFEKLATDAVHGWSYRAGQRVEHFAIPDAEADGISEADRAIAAASETFHRAGATLFSGGLNNWSFASAAPGPKLLERAASSLRETNGPASSALLDNLHPLVVRGEVMTLWSNGHYREAVQCSATLVNGHIQTLLGRKDVSDKTLMSEAFSLSGPAPGKPRLRWPGDPSDQTVKSMQQGILNFSQGCFLAIRNVATHTTDGISQEAASEQLASLSTLMRWVDECEVLTVEEVKGGPELPKTGSAARAETVASVA